MILYTKNTRTTSELTKLSIPRLLYVGDFDIVEFCIANRAMHNHDYLEILYVYEGNGSIIIEEKSYNVSAGDLIVYNSDVAHDENMVHLKIGFVYLGVSHLCLPHLPPNCLISESISPIIHCNHAGKYIYCLFQDLIELMSSELSEQEDTANYLTLAILSLTRELSTHSTFTLEKSNPNRRNTSAVICKKVKQYIKEHYTEDLTIHDISDAVSCSPYHMSRLLKRETGYAPMQYMTRLRLGKAQTLLVHTPMPITDVAFSVGYNSSASFNYAFRKMFKITPAEFRRLYRI